MTIIPSDAGPANVYKLMVGAIVPRPIAFVSTVSRSGVRNLAPFSFFTAASANPPVVCFAPMVRGSDGQQKDTLRNVQETGEFVVNIVSEDFVEKMNICSAEFPPDVDEWEKSGLTPVASDCVKPARVRESRFHMECKLVDVVSVSKQPLGGSLVLGEVLRFHVTDELFDNYRIAPEKLRAVGRMGGPSYARTTDRFDLERPKL
jgi:flavin reductase (DIM6/NTAB) family NADH-FMN oxidoreductase RutF